MLAKNPAARPRCDAAFVERLESIATSLINLRHLVEEGTRELAVEWSSEGERFVFDVLLEDGRRQRVEAEVIPALNEHEPLVTFWSPCAPAIEPHDRFCLEMNGWLPFGAIGIRMWEGQPYFVMVENLPRGSVSPDAIRAAVMHLAQSSDLVEKLLTGKDIH
jgi:hypothetical protein